MMKNKPIRSYLLLHGILLLYSFVGLCSKTAAAQELFSFSFFFYYGLVLLLLAIYALLWQQVLKRLPLTTAFANKAVVIIWGLLWGYLFFGEPVTITKLIGAAVIIFGVCLVVMEHDE